MDTYRLFEMKYYDWELIEEGDKDSIYYLFLTLVSSRIIHGLKILFNDKEIVLYRNNNISIPPKLCLEEFNDGEPCLKCNSVRPPNYSKGYWRMQNTHYENEESNWDFLCEECHEDNDEHWREMWSEYYSNVM